MLRSSGKKASKRTFLRCLLTRLHTFILGLEAVVVALTASIQELLTHSGSLVEEPAHKLTTTRAGLLGLTAHIWNTYGVWLMV